MRVKYMSEAIAAAYEGIRAGDGGPFGAVIVDEKKGVLLSRAHNEVLKRNDPTCHAEIMAIRALGSCDLAGLTMYASGYPCPMCLSAILWARLPLVYYCNDYDMARVIGFDDDAFMHTLGEIYGCKPAFSQESATSILTVRRLSLPEGEKLYADWMNMPGRGHY